MVTIIKDNSDKDSIYLDEILSKFMKLILFVALVFLLGQYIGYVWAFIVNLLGFAGTKKGVS